MKKILVTGAGGFIGYHLVKHLKSMGYWVRGVDIKKPKWGPSYTDEFFLADLREPQNCQMAMIDIDEVYGLGADMGGMGFISKYNSKILRNNMLINLWTLEAAKKLGVKKIFYSSSACIYPKECQSKSNSAPLKESDAFPANPADSYGWEKIMHELRLKYASQDYGIQVRIARFHNTYGPHSEYNSERAKAPGQLCYKVAKAKDGDTIEVWGDGKQTRTFTYVDNLVKGIHMLMKSDYDKPINISHPELVTINHLVKTIIQASGKKIKVKHVKGPQGTRGRASDNTLIKQVLNWEPTTPLEAGIIHTYKWVEKQVENEA